MSECQAHLENVLRDQYDSCIRFLKSRSSFFPSSVPLVMFNRPVLKRNCTFELIVRFESEIMFTMLSEINMISVFFLVYQVSLLVPNPSFGPFVMLNRPVLKRDCTFELIVRFQCEIHAYNILQDQYDSCFFWFIKTRFWFLIPVSVLL